MTELDNMLSGQLYLSADPELVAARLRARHLLAAYNSSPPDDPALRAALLRELLGHAGQGVWIEPPFYCDYGSYIHLEDNVYFNFNCVVLDCAHVHIGAGSMIGPAVQFYAATHPTDAATRATGRELAFPITVGRGVWIGGGAIIGAGLTIGDNSIIGAGSVVTKNIPANVVAVGNPCRVIRPLTPAE
jgi:maltose O-acetyltransferase